MTGPAVPPPSASEREHWRLDPHNAPIETEERERWQRNPARYYVVERLHDAHDELVEALWDRLQTAGRPLSGPPVERERYTAACAHLERAERKWAAALERADELLGDRQEGE
jgi:hypothetical protein